MSRVLLILVIAGVVSAAIYWQETKASVRKLVPIRYVRVEGVFQYIGKDTIKQAMLPYVLTDYFSVDVQALDRAAMQLPWVKSVTVKRIWPDTIEIRLTEQVPVVRWGSKGLLNNEGYLFEPDNVANFSQLPLLYGPKGYEARLLKIMQGLEIDLDDRAMHLTEFKVNERRAWDIQLASGIQIMLGRNGQLKNFQRFLKTLSLLDEDKIAAIAKVDLRYPNGYAITWKPDAPPIDWTHAIVTPKKI